jgi:molybdate transport system substrate-binding protein
MGLFFINKAIVMLNSATSSFNIPIGLKRNAILLIGVIVLIALAGVYTAYQYLAPKPAERLTVFAAASLTKPFQALEAGFEKKYAANVTFNFAGSSTLSTQIIQGSPCDVFASANTKEMTNVKNANMLNGTSTVFAHNSIMVVVSKSYTAGINSLLDLAKPGIRIELADKSVPIGNYALQILMKIDATYGNSSSPLYKGAEWVGFKNKVLTNVVSYDTDVEQVVTKVVTGTADVGIAYKSDAINRANEVSFFEIPSEVNLVAVYPIGAISGSGHAKLAQEFIDYLLSADGQKALTDAGFQGR